MEVKTLKLKLSNEDISNKGLANFYVTIGKILGAEKPSVQYDCTKLLIAKNIQDEFYKTYARLHPEEYARNPDEFSTQVTMLLARSGPKMDKTLSENTIEVQEGFVVGWELNSLLKTGMRKIAVITDQYVRDTQIYRGDFVSTKVDSDWMFGDNYFDAKYPCHYIGIFEGNSDDEIKEMAAQKVGVYPDIISLLEI